MSSGSLSRTLLLTVTLPLFLGCKTVRPYQRAPLMTDVMVYPADSFEANFEAHVLNAREVMIGASLGEGASCGCM